MKDGAVESYRACEEKCTTVMWSSAISLLPLLHTLYPQPHPLHVSASRVHHPPIQTYLLPFPRRTNPRVLFTLPRTAKPLAICAGRNLNCSCQSSGSHTLMCQILTAASNATVSLLQRGVVCRSGCRERSDHDRGNGEDDELHDG